jgi:hypothetical protein
VQTRASFANANDRYPHVVRAAFDVLDRYHTTLSNRDPTKSLNEDPHELLLRVRRALQTLMFSDTVPRDDVAEIARQIEDLLAADCSGAQSPVSQK